MLVQPARPQTPAAVTDFASANSAQRLEILREVVRQRDGRRDARILLPIIKEGLHDPDPDVRQAVLRIAVPYAWASLQVNTVVRLAASPLVGKDPVPQNAAPSPKPPQHPSPPPAGPLFDWGGDREPLRTELRDLLASVLTKDGDERLRYHALLALGDIQMSPRSDWMAPLLPALVDLYRHDRSDRIRAEVVKTFRLEQGTARRIEMRDVIRDALIDLSPPVRREARSAISAQRLGGPVKVSFAEARGTIVPALQHEDARMRLAAVQALDAFGASSAAHLPVLGRLSRSDPDGDVRAAARLAAQAIQRAGTK